MLKILDIKEFDKFYNILEESFPVDERRPYFEQKKLMDNKYYKIYANEDSGDIRGFFAIYDFDKVLYIEHFAVNQKYRNNGLGTKLLDELKKITNKEICLEVEPPIGENEKRRIDFYKRNKFLLNEFHYIQPPMSKGQKEVRLYLMTLKKPLLEKEFYELRDLLYKNVYNIK